MSTTTSTIDRQKSGRIIVTVTVPPADAHAAEQSALTHLGSRVNVKGFRPGKAPESVLREKIDPQALFEETIRTAMRSVMPSLIKEHQLSPVIPPRIEAVSRDPLTLNITFIERPRVTVKNAQKLTPPAEPITIDTKDIERVIQSALAEHRTFAAVDRAARHGDRVTMRFTATDEKGEVIAGLKADAEQVVLGEGRLLPGFEDALIGLAPGQEKTFTLRLPEKFPAEALRNTDVTVHVTVTNVEDVTTPAFDDAFAKERLQQPSAQAFRDMIEQTLRSQEEQFRRMSRERALLDAIRENTQADLPDELIEQELQHLVEEWAQRLEAQGTSVEDALKRQGKTAKEMEAELHTEAKNRQLLRLGIAQLLEDQKVELTAAEEQAGIDAFMQHLSDEDRAESMRRFAAKDSLYDEVRWRTLVDKLISSLLS